MERENSSDREIGREGSRRLHQDLCTRRSEHHPTLRVSWNEQKFGLTVGQCDEQLRTGSPRIEVLTKSNPSLVSAVSEGSDTKHEAPENQLEIVSMTIQGEEDLVAADRYMET
jgi:L-seryl-tRNA(Ser) seleniumtransferase